MTTEEVFNYYINTANKDRDDKNYCFNYRFGQNLYLKEDESATFKLINFSMMNSMLNVSSYHKNNYFKISDNGTMITITIPDGNYSVLTLRDKINQLTGDLPLALNYDKTTNSYYWNCSENGIIFYPMDMKMILGFKNGNYYLSVGDTYGDDFANLLPYTKILITTNNLAFNPSTDNNLNREYSANEGINEIICWINKDEPPFTTLKYENLMNVEFKLSNNNLTYINFSIMNEYKEYIRDCPNSFLHFQIIVKKNNITNN